jgi:hypothetical protein
MKRGRRHPPSTGEFQERGAAETAVPAFGYKPRALGDLAALAPRLLPLDPVVLPVLARVLRRFGQNERCLFSFLSSAEPYGLMDHARAAHKRLQVYRLHNLYDYLTTNLSSALAAGPAAKRFRVVDSVIRSATVDNALELAALKPVGLLNLLDDRRPCPHPGALNARPSRRRARHIHCDLRRQQHRPRGRPCGPP